MVKSAGPLSLGLRGASPGNLATSSSRLLIFRAWPRYLRKGSLEGGGFLVFFILVERDESDYYNGIPDILAMTN